MESINKAIVRSIDILTFLANTEKSVTLSEISRALDIPKSTALDLLQTLVAKDFVAMDNLELKTYCLGLGMFLLGSEAINKNSLQKTAEEYLENLCAETGKTIFLAIPNKKEVVYILKKEGKSSVQLIKSVGSTNPMHLTGLGKCILANKTDEEIVDFYGEGPYETMTAYSVDTKEQLLKEIEVVRKEGFAFDDRENIDLICCFAAPVYDYTNEVIGAISMVCLVNEVGATEKQYYPQLIKKIAMAISKKMGYEKNHFYSK